MTQTLALQGFEPGHVAIYLAALVADRRDARSAGAIRRMNPSPAGDV